MDQRTPRRPWWRRCRFSLRSLMAIILIVGGGLGSLVHRASVQRGAVRAIRAAQGRVRYDFEMTPFSPGRINPPGPKWLVDFLGVDYFADVAEVDFRTGRMPPGLTTVVYAAPQSDAILVEIGRLTHLERLDAVSVRVTDAGMAHLAGLTRLRSLGIDGTSGLTDAGLAHLAGLKQLEFVDIQGNSSIEGSGLAHFTDLQRLEYLCLEIETHHGLENLTQLLGLKRLLLQMTNINDEAIGQLARLTRLEELAFGGDAEVIASLAPLKALPELKHLCVYGFWVDDAVIAPVAEMAHLETFFVADTTRVTAQGLYNLQQRRPSLRIVINGTGQAPQAHLNRLRRSVGPKAIPPGPPE